MRVSNQENHTEYEDIHVCCQAEENTIPVRPSTRSRRMKKTAADKKVPQKKNITLVCVFPSENPDLTDVRKEVKSILEMELRHQLQNQNN